jgi:signal transduction histidine kinase
VKTILQLDSLRSRLLVFTVVPLVALLLGFGFVVLRGLELELERRLRDEVQLVARAIRLPLSHALERGRTGSLEQAIDSAFRINRIYGAYVYDDGGNLVAGTGAERPALQSDRLVRIAEGGQRRGEFDGAHGVTVYSYFVPLTDSGGRISGLLHITRRGSDFDTYLARLRWLGLALIGALVGLLGLVLTYGYRRAIGDPLRTVTEAMADIVGGDRARRVRPHGPLEMLRLGAGINAMLDSISASDAQIAAQRDEQAQLERRLRQSEKLAAIGQLAAGVAHELGSPLSVIQGEAQRQQRAGSPDRRGQGLERMRTAVRRMQHIVAQLLDFSRANRLRLSPVALDRIARSALASVRDEAFAAGVRVEAAGPQPATLVRVDKLRVEQALTNLLRNAIQAAPRGRVRFTWFDAGTEAGYAVEDDGPGVPPELLERVFEPFFTTKGVGEGTGLGLAVVHGVAAEHGAQVGVSRSDLGGAAFRLVVPTPGAAQDRAGDLDARE